MTFVIIIIYSIRTRQNICWKLFMKNYKRDTKKNGGKQSEKLSEVKQ